jgi:hypothetical protein
VPIETVTTLEKVCFEGNQLSSEIQGDFLIMFSTFLIKRDLLASLFFQHDKKKLTVNFFPALSPRAIENLYVYVLFLISSFQIISHERLTP